MTLNRPYALIADDEVEIRTVVSMLLEQMGYQPIQVIDGYEALEIIKEGKFPIQVLITDFEMPRLLGTDLIRQIAKLGNPIDKIILFTGKGLDDPRIIALIEEFCHTNHRVVCVSKGASAHETLIKHIPLISNSPETTASIVSSRVSSDKL